MLVEGFLFLFCSFSFQHDWDITIWILWQWRGMSGALLWQRIVACILRRQSCKCESCLLFFNLRMALAMFWYLEQSQGNSLDRKMKLIFNPKIEIIVMLGKIWSIIYHEIDWKESKRRNQKTRMVMYRGGCRPGMQGCKGSPLLLDSLPYWCKTPLLKPMPPRFNPSTPIPFHPSRGNGSISAMRYRKFDLRRCRVCLLGEGVSERNELAYQNLYGWENWGLWVDE